MINNQDRRRVYLVHTEAGGRRVLLAGDHRQANWVGFRSLSFSSLSLLPVIEIPIIIFISFISSSSLHPRQSLSWPVVVSN